VADRSTPKSRTPTRSQPHPNTPLIGPTISQQLNPTRHPCTPSLHMRQQTREATDANGNEKESMKNHRVAHAAPPCITRSLFHTVYVQNPLTCTTNPPSQPPHPQRPSLTSTTKPATQQRPTQHPAKQAQGRTGNPTQRQERTRAHDLTCTHLHPDIPTKSPRTTQVHA